jgi:uncharacterized membrane protein YhaH (DUF805 family)
MKRLLNNLKVVSFEGRIGVKEYWLTMFALFGVVFVLSFTVPFALVLLASVLHSSETIPFIYIGIMIFLFTVYGIYISIWSLSMIIRRLHDQNYSGWMYLLSLIPFVGGIIILILTILPGQLHDNNYGPVRDY